MASMNTHDRAPSLNLAATETAIPSYGALQDTATLTDICIRLQVRAAVAHVKGDRTTEMAAKNQRAALMYTLQKEKSARSTAKRHRYHPMVQAGHKSSAADIGSKHTAPATATKILYSPVLQSDDSESQGLPLERIAKKAFYRAKKCRLDFDELFGDTLANLAEDKRDYSQISKDQDHAVNKRIARALSKGVHDLLAKDYCEHHSREMKLLGDAYEKWTPRLTPVAVECYRFG